MNLADRYQALTLSDIQRFVTDGQEENLFLDFKTVNKPELTSDDKKNFAKALSGFANSSGGLLIWGVEARKNEAGVDCACAIKEIPNVSFFLTRLNEFTGVAVSPIVDGVQHRVISTQSECGVVVTLIPESFSGPHMAKLGEDRYYKRSGGSFYRMEHFDIDDMFGRRKRPKLMLSHRVVDRGSRTRIVFGIRNVGRGPAKAPYLTFSVPDGFKLSEFGVDGNCNEGLPRLPHDTWYRQPRYGGNSSVVIHPGVTLDVAAIDTRDRVPVPTSIEINFSMTAEDVQVETSTMQIQL
jgi:hypothetical protein